MFYSGYQHPSVHPHSPTRLAKLDALIGAISQGKWSKVGCDCIPPHLPCRSRPSDNMIKLVPWVSLIPCELLECVVTEKHIYSIIKVVKMRKFGFF